MQDANGQRPSDLTHELLRGPTRFSFFQGVRLLTSSQFSVRYRNSVSFSYPAGDIESIRVLGDGEPDVGGTTEVTPAFMGLLGSYGTLSASYTDRVLDAESRGRKGAPRAFFDVLIQRPLAQFHEAWRYRHPALGYEIPGVSSLSHALRSLVAAAAPERGDADTASEDTPDDYIKPLIAALRQRTLSGPYLARVLSAVTGVAVRVEDHVLAWYPLAELETRLGVENTTLGSMMLGSHTQQRQLRIRLHIGPLRHARYREFLQDGAGAETLRTWLARTLGHSYEYEVAPILHRDDVTSLQLGEAGLGCLGQDAFLLSGPSSEHRSDVRYLLTI